MQARVLLAVAIVALPAALAGCIGNDDERIGLSAVPDDVSPTGRTVEVKMWVETIEQEIYPGFMAELWAFCAEALPGSEDAVKLRDGRACSVPGPTLHVDQGDRLVVEFRNPHDFPHTIHWHGQHLPNEMDGVPGATQDTTQQGTSYVYDYIVERSGTLMYHCHVDTQHHVFMGLYGAIIVEPQDQALEPEVDKEYTLVLSHGNKDHMAVPPPGADPHANHRGEFGSGNPGKQNGEFNVDYDIFMINGRSAPLTLKDEDSLIRVDEGDRVRLRLLNIGFLAESMHLHGHDMLVTHKDGLPLQPGAQFLADTLRIDPGERYDVLVVANKPGKWMFHTHYPQHVSNDHQYPGGMLTQMVYPGYENATFKAELPGGMPDGGADQGPPLPPDYTATETGEITGADEAVSFTFPVEDARAEMAELTLTMSPTVPVAALPVDELTLTVTDPDGTVLQSATVTAAEPSATMMLANPSKLGDYTATVEGRGLQASFTLDIVVKYPAAGGQDDGHGGHGH